MTLDWNGDLLRFSSRTECCNDIIGIDQHCAWLGRGGLVTVYQFTDYGMKNYIALYSSPDNEVASFEIEQQTREAMIPSARLW